MNIEIQKKVSIPMSVSTKYVTTEGIPYTGETTFTPSDEQQTVHTAGYYVQSNITINPIPSNYGLITYNGSVITVS